MKIMCLSDRTLEIVGPRFNNYLSRSYANIFFVCLFKTFGVKPLNRKTNGQNELIELISALLIRLIDRLLVFFIINLFFNENAT